MEKKEKTHKEESSHTTHAAHTKHKTQQSDNSFIWKVGFFVLLGIVVIFGAYTFYGSADGTIKNNSPNNNMGGTGKIVIEEFSEFECPFCARAQPTIKQVLDTYGDRVELVYKHFPLNFHPNAQKAAEASECARDQGKFWEYHDKLFANQNAITVPDLKRYAADMGLDTATFNSCLDTGAKAALVAADLADGRSRGVTGTPTFFINGEKLVGAQPFSEFKKIIDNKLGGQQQAPAPSADPSFEFLVINDPSCTECSTQDVIDAVTTQLFTTARLRTIDVNSQEAQDLIEQYNLMAVPAYLFGKEVAQASSFSNIQQVLEDKGAHYVVSAGASGRVRYLTTPEIGNAPVLGDSNAPITIFEWSDFECPFCKRFADDAYVQIKSQYVDTGKVKIVFKHFPLSFHANAQKAAEASACAQDQGKFWEYHDKLFVNQNALTVASLKTYAADLGLDTATFNSCLDSGAKAQMVQQDMVQGQTFGVTGTPGFFIQGKTGTVISGAQPFESFRQVIDSELSS